MGRSFAKDQEGFYRSQGWTKLDDKDKNKNKHIYDQVISSAGADKTLTHDEYKNIFNDRGPWGKYAYNRDSIAAALAEAGTSGGIKLDANARYFRDNDLAFDGDDVLLRGSGGWDDFDIDLRSSGKASYERGYDDGDDDYMHIYRFTGANSVADPDPVDPDPVDPDPVDPDPDPFNPDPVVPPGGTLPGTPDPTPDPTPSTNIPDPQVGGGGFQDDWNPSGRRLGLDLTPAEQMGSIPFVTSNQYRNRYKSGRFVDFLNNEPQSSSRLANSLIASMWDDSDSFLS